MPTKIFNNIDKFRTNSELFLNFAFFRFIELLGVPFLEKISQYNYLDDCDAFFRNLKVKCDYEEKEIDGEKVSYLNLIFNKNNNDLNGFNTYIYSLLNIHGKIIKLNGYDDKYESNADIPRIRLSSKTSNIIKNIGYNGKKYTNWELYYDNESAYDPVFNSLIDLYLNNKNTDENDYYEKYVWYNTGIATMSVDGENQIDFFDRFEVNEVEALNSSAVYVQSEVAYYDEFVVEAPEGYGFNSVGELGLNTNEEFKSSVFTKSVVNNIC